MSDEATVLIIDDDDMVRRSLKRVLEHGGLRVIEASDGISGLRAARLHNPGAVLLDLRMPGMDGLEVLSALLEHGPEMTVLVVSGQGTMADAVEALRRGAWDFVAKPVPNPENFLRTVRRGLEKSHLTRQNREYSDSLKSMNERLSAALEELQADQRAARQLQFQLLPRDGLRLGAYNWSRRLFPSQVLSGDFLDYFPLGRGLAGFYVADVAGHGAASAFVTAILTTLVEKYRERFESHGDETILQPERLLTLLDADLETHRLGKHVTMFFGIVDSNSGRLSYANAGAFPFPFVAEGGRVTELECIGRPLNLPCSGGFGHGEMLLGPDSRLLIASDGVLELQPKRSHRERRDFLAQVMREARSLDMVLASLDLDESTPLTDDIALLFIDREPTHA